MDPVTQLQQINPTYVQMLFIGLSLLIILIEIPLAMNKVRPNQTYGFRVAKTLSDDRVWYAANSYAAKGSIATGMITILVAVALRSASIPLIAYGSALAAVFFAGLISTIIGTLLYIKRIS